jgi:hypothetical protein
MLSYATVGSNDFDRSLPFYTALLEPEGVTKLFDTPAAGCCSQKTASSCSAC